MSRDGKVIEVTKLSAHQLSSVPLPGLAVAMNVSIPFFFVLSSLLLTSLGT